MMKVKLATFAVALFASASAQSQSIGFGYSSERSLQFNVTIEKESLSYQIGMAVQNSNAVEKKVSERKSNYGRERIGAGDTYTSIDVGVGFPVSQSTKIFLVGTVGRREYFTNYSDGRFNGDGYHMVDRDESIAGAGVSVQFGMSRNIGLGVGVSSVHGAVATMQYIF